MLPVVFWYSIHDSRLVCSSAEPAVRTYNRVTATVSDASVVSVAIDTGSLLTLDGAPVGSVTLLDDGAGGDVTAGDGVFSADGIGFQSTTQLLGGVILRFRNIDFTLSDSSGVSSTHDLGLTLRYMDDSLAIPSVSDIAPDVRATSHVVSIEMPLLGVFPAFSFAETAVTQRYYQLFPDDRDWLMLAHPFNTASPAGSFTVVRNDVQGIGLT